MKGPETILKQVRDLRSFGSCCLSFCWIASSRIDAAYEYGIHIWDIAAGCVILEESGGIFTDYQGRRHDRKSLSQPKISLVAANPIVNQLLVDILKDSQLD